MTTLRQFSKLFCLGCGEITLHDGVGCIHRSTCGGRHVVVQIEDVARRANVSTGYDSLQPNERKILLLLGTGVSVSQVARSMRIAEATVKSQRSRICAKLNIKLGSGRDVLRDYVSARGLVDEASARTVVQKHAASL